MMQGQPLAQVFKGFKLRSPLPGNIVVTAITDNSREVVNGSVFFAISGTVADGREFIGEAVARGAVVVVVEGDTIPSTPADKAIYLAVPDAREALAVAANNFYGSPSDELWAIGVTGTNGKTSICWLVAELLARLGVKTAQLGTLGSRIVSLSSLGKDAVFEPSATTTPSPIAIARFLRMARRDGASAAAFEVSSHALEQKRTFGINWDRAVFTNLTRDHLDYHGSFENYRAAKLKLFERDLITSAKSGKGAVLNIDEEFGVFIRARLADAAPDIRSYSWSVGRERMADAYVSDVTFSLSGTRMDCVVFGKKLTLSTKLIGDYNVHNVIAAVLTVTSLGYAADDVASALSDIDTVPGRLESVGSATVGVYVDYAHTPDGLISAQQALRRLTAGKLITVFGCGGNRDQGKRPLMGKAVAELSDIAIVTSDNPRDEEPQAIIDEILPGFSGVITERGFAYHVREKRADAIRLAIELAQPGDIVLVAGKGHEPYQEIKGVRYPFSDQAVCKKILAEYSR